MTSSDSDSGSWGRATDWGSFANIHIILYDLVTVAVQTRGVISGQDYHSCISVSVRMAGGRYSGIEYYSRPGFCCTFC